MKHLQFKPFDTPFIAESYVANSTFIELGEICKCYFNNNYLKNLFEGYLHVCNDVVYTGKTTRSYSYYYCNFYLCFESYKTKIKTDRDEIWGQTERVQNRVSVNVTDKYGKAKINVVVNGKKKKVQIPETLTNETLLVFILSTIVEQANKVAKYGIAAYTHG